MNEEKLIEENEILHNSNLDEIIDFFSRVLENIKEEIKNGITWDNLILLPGLEDQINLTKKGMEEDMNNYKKEILEKQIEKDDLIIKKKKQLDANEEKFIVKSKEMIQNFKKLFEKFCEDLNEGKYPNIKTPDEAAKYVGLYKLKDSLLEIEIYEKEQLNIFIKGFKEDVIKIDDIMKNKTNILKEKLDMKKNVLKEKIEHIINEIKIKAKTLETKEIYEEVKEEEVQKDSKLEKILNIINLGDFNSDKDKIIEILDDKISKLKDSIDHARTTSTENYFDNIINNDYYRNKYKVEDIAEIYSIYYNKLIEEIFNLQSFDNSNFH